LAASSIPNAVDETITAELRRHWTDDEIVEILGVVALFGFLNRWNDSMATTLEGDAERVGAAHLAARGWSAGKHR
jgi:alkylhydroperoxidase family enzyme